MNAHAATLLAGRTTMRTMRGLLLVVLLLPLAAAHPEAAAPELDPMVEAVGHAPETPQAGEQWTGFIRLAPDHNVTNVTYFICRVGVFCLAPAAATLDDDGRTFRWDTNEYIDAVSQRPTQWAVGDGSDWHVGYKFVFHRADGSNDKFPVGLPLDSDECKQMSFFDCDATHYFVFTIPGAKAPQESTPSLGLPLLLIALLVLARRP